MTTIETPAKREGDRAGGRWLCLSLLLFLFLLFFAITTHRLADYPVWEAAQNGIAAPAYKLANEGVYGNDLYRGFYQTESHNYEYMPLYPLVVAFSYELLGFGAWQGRFVSVLCGLLALALTFALGRRLAGERAGLLAVGVLALLPLAVPRYGAGEIYPGAIPLVDLARALRYDVMVPVWVLASTLAFWRAYDGGRRRNYLFAGVLAGLATLSHVYGAFILGVFGLFLLWEQGVGSWRRPALYLVAAGWLLALLPWGLYVVQAPAAFRGQMLRHSGRLDPTSLLFYLSNLRGEPWRYVRFLGAFRQPVLWPRPGLWLALLSVAVANASLWRDARRGRSAARLLLLAPITLFLLLGLLISFKRYPYVILFLPFVALQVAIGLKTVWTWAEGRSRLWRAALVFLALAAVGEGALKVYGYWRDAEAKTPLEEVVRPAREMAPPGSRIVGLHHYWLEMAEYDFLALDLAFVRGDPHYGFTQELALPAAMAMLEPDFVLVSEELLYGYRRNPAALPGDKVAALWRALDGYLEEGCRLRRRGPADPNYGTLLVFQCS